MANLEKVNGGMKLLNQIALFVILGTIALSIVWMLGGEIWNHFKSKPDEITVKAEVTDKNKPPAKTEITLRVGEIEKISSSNLYIAKIEEPTDSYAITYRSSKSITRNVLMSAENSDKTRLLFDNYENKISKFETYPSYDKAEIIVCVYVKNFKSSDDEDSTKKSIMLISPDGIKKRTVAVDVDKIMKIEKSNKNSLNVLYFKQGKLINARYSIDNLNVISEPAIFDLKNTNLKNSNLVEGE
jgi:hypothetical protein